MKKLFKVLAGALSALLLLGTAACGGSNDSVKRVEDTRELTAFEYTTANITALDKTGRYAPAGDVYNGNDVGVFYHTWHGVHETAGKVLNITELLEENPDYLGSDYLEENQDKFHYWDEPLYGYYCSSDPWVITRHIELMMAMGVDFMAYDYTNNVQYTAEADAIFEILQKYYDQGFTNVPKVVFYTNTGSANVICDLYRRYYKEGKYSDLWYKPNGKPLIVGVAADRVSSANRDLYDMLKTDFFDFRETQWPNTTTVENLETGFPWMNWVYPQKNYNGMMSVSLAQHPSAKMSYGALTNNGRGYDWTKMRNYSKNTEIGTNYDGQWKTVFENNADSSKKYVTQVLVTGFNEWMAQKLSDGNESFFVDTFSQEYSRDIEMMKGGYDDNYVIQTLINTRAYKFSEAKRYTYPMNTVDLSNLTAAAWDVKTTYKDMVGDAMERNYRDAFKTTTYVDTSNRNDIATVQVTHDKQNLYVRVETAQAITVYNGTDKNWMNLLISTEQSNEASFGGFQYIVNRTPNADGTTTVEKSAGGYAWQSAGTASYAVVDNVIVYSIPLASLGLNADNCHVRIKASDNVTKYDDIMDYYVSGDSAPIGRFAYEYGY